MQLRTLTIVDEDIWWWWDFCIVVDTGIVEGRAGGNSRSGSKKSESRKRDSGAEGYEPNTRSTVDNEAALSKLQRR